MQTKKIAVFDAKPYDTEFFDAANLKYGYAVKYFKGHLTVDTLPLAQGFDAVCLFVNDTVNPPVIEKLTEFGIRLIALRCAGYNNIDLKSAYNKIHVVRVPSYSPYAVAEHAMAMMLTLNRKTHKAYNRTQEGNFTISGLLGFDMSGKTLGVIGTGQIGKILIRIAQGFGMKVAAFDSFPNPEFAKTAGFDYVELPALYQNSDIISLHCPLTPETQYIINKESIERMKDGVMLINTSRGKLIDTKALIEGLKDRKIGYAGLDVYEEESEYFFEDFSAEILDDDVLARLLTFSNVLITSHQAFFTREALTNIAETTLQNIAGFFDGKPLANEICYRCGQDTAACGKVTAGKCF